MNNFIECYMNLVKILETIILLRKKYSNLSEKMYLKNWFLEAIIKFNENNEN